MGKLGLNRLLQIMLVPPLLALTAFGGLLILDTLRGYREIDRLSALEQFVSAAGRLAITALNQESIATQSYVASGSEAQRAEMRAARQRSDEAIRLFRETAASAELIAVPHALPHLESGKLVRLVPQWYADAGPISIYYASRTLMPAKARVFVDFVVEAFRSQRLAERFAGSVG
jgi:DNA-binding transcriptional LysR family regulator